MARPTPLLTPNTDSNLWTRLCAAAAAGALACVVSSAGGCYSRVVSAHGFGADQYDVSEPYQESGKLDDWIFGSPKRTNKTLLPQD